MNDINFKLRYINSGKRFRIISEDTGNYLYDGWNSTMYVLPYFLYVEDNFIKYNSSYELSANIFINDVLMQNLNFGILDINQKEEKNITIKDIKAFLSLDFNSINQQDFFQFQKNVIIFKIIYRIINKRFTSFNCLKCNDCAYMRICCMKKVLKLNKGECVNIKTLDYLLGEIIKLSFKDDIKKAFIKLSSNYNI